MSDGFKFQTSATIEDVAGAAFQALVSSGWAIFHAMDLVGRQALGGSAPDDVRVKWARVAFEDVASRLPQEHPFRAPLERYAEEELPRRLRMRSGSEGVDDQGPVEPGDAERKRFIAEAKRISDGDLAERRYKYPYDPQDPRKSDWRVREINRILTARRHRRERRPEWIGVILGNLIALAALVISVLSYIKGVSP